jgi:hypothetical protein
MPQPEGSDASDGGSSAAGTCDLRQLPASRHADTDIGLAVTHQAFPNAP